MLYRSFNARDARKLRRQMQQTSVKRRPQAELWPVLEPYRPDRVPIINTIPEELFTGILSSVLDQVELDQYYHWLHSLGLVCRRWRSIILSHREFWAKIIGMCSTCRRPYLSCGLYLVIFYLSARWLLEACSGAVSRLSVEGTRQPQPLLRFHQEGSLLGRNRGTNVPLGGCRHCNRG